MPNFASKRRLITRRRISAAAGPSAETTAFLARTSGLDATHQTAYTNLIDGLVVAGVWAKLDFLYVSATQDLATSRLNLKSSSYALVDTVTTPSFVADRGVTAAFNQPLNTQYTPSTAGGNYTLNSAHAMVWSNSTTQSVAGDLGVVTGGDFIFMITGPTDNKVTVNTTTNAQPYGGAATGKGMYLGNRTSSSNRDAYLDGAFISNTGSGTTSTLPTGVVHYGGVNGNGDSSKQLSASSLGSALTSGEVTAFYNHLSAYMTAVGNV